MNPTCISCEKKVSKLFSLGDQPMANKFPIAELPKIDEWHQNLNAYFCDQCLYINVACDLERSDFFEDYYYLSSVNDELVQHFQNLAKQIAKNKPTLVVDVGSNDGILLKPLRDLGVNAIGVDPSHNVGAIANRNKLETIIGFFDLKVAETILGQRGPADVIVASSVFTHLDNPGQFFEVADALLTKDGQIIIEVEYLGDIIHTLGFERFYFDRPHYFSITTIQRLAANHQFTLEHVEHISPHGGSVRLSLSRSRVTGGATDINYNEHASLSSNFILESFAKFTDSCAALCESLSTMKLKGERVAGYGCPARFSTITNFANIDSTLLPFVIDDSPLKQGLSSPGKRIPIMSFEQSEEVQNYILFAYEYASSIRKRVEVKQKNVKFFRPVPFQQLP